MAAKNSRVRRALGVASGYLVGNVIWNFLFDLPIVGLLVTFFNVRHALRDEKGRIDAAAKGDAAALMTFTVIAALLTGELGRTLRLGFQIGSLSDVWSLWWRRVTSISNWLDQWMLVVSAIVCLGFELYSMRNKAAETSGVAANSAPASSDPVQRNRLGSSAGARSSSGHDLGQDVSAWQPTAEDLPKYVSRNPMSDQSPGLGELPKTFGVAEAQPSRPPTAHPVDPDQFRYGGSIAAVVDPGTPATFNDRGMVQPPSSGQLFDPTGRSDYTKTVAQPGVRLTSPDMAPHAAAFLINLNMADQGQLEALPGVGRVTAKAILDYRAQHGGFTRVEQLKEVNGIGDKTFELVRDMVTI